MLKTLIKYDYRAEKRLMFPAILGLLGLSVLTALLLSVSMAYGTNTQSMRGTSSVFAMLSTLSVTMLCIAAVAVMFGSLILAAYRYYTNLMSDEGYLSFTLPVTMDQHICSKFIVALIWEVLAFISIVVAAVLCIEGTSLLYALFTGTAYNSLILSWLPSFVATDAYLYIIEVVVLAFAFIISINMQVYLAISIGNLGSRSKFKVLIALAAYVGINYATGIVQSVVIYPMIYSIASIGDKAIHIILIIIALIQLVIGVICYLITRNILNKKLNL